MSHQALTYRLAIFLIGFGLLGFGCFCLQRLTARGSESTQFSATESYALDPDWLEVRQLLATKCLECHRSENKRTDFTSYESLIAAKDDLGDLLIVPGKSDESPLWDQICWNVENHADSDLPEMPMMPPDEMEWLTEVQLTTIKRWIDRGALQYQLPKTCNITPLTTYDFPSAKQCKACHPRQYTEWSRSMHAYAQHSPAFVAFNDTLQERTGGTLGTFCSRCHTPIGTTLGENGLLPNTLRSKISMEGVTCVVCHRRKEKRYKASGRISIAPGQVLDSCIYGPFEDTVSQELGAHPTEGHSYLKSSQFCAECHDVTNPAGVRLEEAFSEWQNSPAAQQGQTCQGCHMSPVQGQHYADFERPLGRAAEVPGVDPKHLPLRRLSNHTMAGP
ncbi:MAG: hypothetical protein MPJ24_09465, partial [Pirellulaceae bacterium]|nr:hypothetical protein [Pirellulaceae bacterium]